MPAASSPRLILKTGEFAGTVFPITAAELSMGRDPACDIHLDSPGVSRRHARLLLQPDAILLEDLGSSNGTFVNGVRLRPSRQLTPGDEIRLGQSMAFEYQAELVHQPPVEATLFEGIQLESVITPAAPTSTLLEQLPPTHATMIGEEAPPDLRRQPPQIIVTIAGEPPRTYPLTRPQLHLGRSPENDIIIASPIVSRSHAILEQVHLGYQLSVLPEAGNPVLFEGRPLSAARLLQHGDTLRIGSLDPGSMVTLTFQAPGLAAEQSSASQIQFGAKTVISIGRDPANDVVLPSPTVSRFHAQVERVGQRFRLRDLHSANGTYVNDQRLEAAEVWLQPSDVVRIGRHTFRMDQDQLSQVEEARGLRVEAYGLNKWVRKDLNILQNISLTFQPREFIVVVGQSGGGKSTLVDAIAGYRPASHGQVLVNGANVYRNFDAVRNDIGFVPQRDIIHTELTVYQALDYAAKLRMPRDTSPAERHQRITEVLEDLDLTHRKDNPITRLSGGQQKRVSIGVELLTQPGLFFLDEPTSGLDPGTETAFMHLMRRLADQGRTIVMVTHATKNVMLADKVVFLARGGYMAWFGPPDEALKYFDSYRSERERRAHSMEFDQIYAILDDPSKGSAEEWAKRFTEHPAFQQYVVQPLQARQTVAIPGVGVSAPAPEAAAAPKAKPKSRASALHQFMVLSARNLRILMRDRSSLILMVLAPILVGALDFIIAPLMGSNPYDFMTGDAANGSLTLFLLALDCLLVAGLSQMREFVKEADIYKRERLVNLKILPYVSSKVWIALLLAFYQGAAYTIIHHLAFEMPGGALEIGLFYVTMVLAAMAGMMTGLLASAIAPAASSAPMLMILLVIPQIVLSGILAPVPENISAVATTRWSFEGLIGVTGYGSDVAADPCWQLSEELRDAMTLDDKAANSCRCMGLAVFEPGSCNFPGLGQYIVPELSQAAPVEPAALPPKPAEPVIPTAPDPPADQNDQVAMVQYLNALQSYQDEVALIQEQYKSAMGLYEAQADLYQAEMESFATDRLEYESARNGAVERAEGVIESVREEFGWAWVDKSDPQVFYPWLYTAWGAQLIISAVYFVIILFLIKRKDNV